MRKELGGDKCGGWCLEMRIRGASRRIGERCNIEVTKKTKSLKALVTLRESDVEMGMRFGVQISVGEDLRMIRRHPCLLAVRFTRLVLRNLRVGFQSVPEGFTCSGSLRLRLCLCRRG